MKSKKLKKKHKEYARMTIKERESLSTLYCFNMVLAILIRAEIKGVHMLKIMEKVKQMIQLLTNKVQKYGMKCTRLVQIPKRRILNWIVNAPLSTTLGTIEALEQGLWNLEGLQRLLQQPNVEYVRQMVYEI